MLHKRSPAGVLFDTANYIFLIGIALITLLPFLHIVAGSLASAREVLNSRFILFPREFSLEAYRFIFSESTLSRSLATTVYITVVGTFVNMAMTSLMAYPLSRNIKGKRPIMLLIVFTLLFSGGMIPSFLVVKSLGLLNSYGALWLPGAISPFYLIIIINFFKQLPVEFEESAKIDGCSDPRILWSIILPLSMPVMATFSLFYAIAHWNTFFQALIYINDASRWPIQVLLRQIVIMSSGGIGDASFSSETTIQVPPQTVKMAVIVVSTLPIIVVYPFLQKHFTKGVLVGSIKG
ncbi:MULTISPECIES: carbohydrate ABC transporter permease [Paenibacillus]|jgi:putative aldouronate transport system permease protein|uniref:Carbohydrate ABC transporter permease n=1 Tax=Paenibacillus baimaensis TaxID=2982185 RepID=A0ABT2UPM6_9BACL|nr:MULTISPECIES: carbohydrate ABC transporter permease [unclassified Paenibacillus]MCU6795986.1 carbohydrate ABC transporter permease [Paenibacillus sp. WQ 127069]OMF20990.1 ABC transporter permease [Paenibacillus sp. FSL H7-0331]